MVVFRVLGRENIYVGYILLIAVVDLRYTYLWDIHTIIDAINSCLTLTIIIVESVDLNWPH